jgi:hypothetical protein
MICAGICWRKATLAIHREMEEGKHTWSLYLEAQGPRRKLITTRSDFSGPAVRPPALRERGLFRGHPRLADWLTRSFGSGDPYDVRELAVLVDIISRETGWPVANREAAEPVAEERLPLYAAE